ncbi:MAG: tetratricopeptide repeat protein [Myxococcota bacterium]
MKVKCTKCNTEYNIDASRIGPNGIKIKCPKCLNSFLVKQNGGIADSTAAPTPPPPPKEATTEKKSAVATKSPEAKPKETPKIPPPPPIEEPSENGTQKSNISIDNLPDLPDLPDLPEIGTDTGDLLSTLDKELGTSAPQSSTITHTPQSQKAEDTSSGLDFGMINLDDAIASSISQPSQDKEKPKAEPINVTEVKRDIPQTDTATQHPEQSTAKKYKVKRRSGKIFGPFDEETIVRMLIENKLLGNEEVCEDGVTWQSISKIPQFQKAIQSMLENISHTPQKQLSQSQPAEKVKTEDKREDKKKVDVKKEGTKEPTKFDEFKTTTLEKLRELKERYSTLPKNVKKGVIAGTILVVVLLLGLTGYKVYTKIFGGRLSGTELQIVNTAINSLNSGNYADIQSSTNALKGLYAKIRYKTPVCSVLSRIFMYQRTFLSIEKENEELLSRCIKDIRKERLNTPDSLFALGIYLAAAQDIINLKEVYQSLNSSPHYQSYINAIKNLYSKNNVQAIADFENYLKVATQDSLTMEILGEVYLNQSNKDAARQWFKKAIDTNPKNLRAAIELQRLKFIDGEDQKASISIVENIINSNTSLHPLELARAEFVLAQIYFSIRKNEEADRYFKSSISHSGGKIEYKIAYAEYLYHIEELDKSFDEFNNVIKQDPSNLNAKLGLVKIMIKQRKILNAHKTIMELYSQNASNPFVLLYKGKIEEELEKFKEAEESYNQILSTNKDFVEARLALANLNIKQNKIEEGLVLLEALKKEHPQNTNILSMMGETYLKLKKIDPAIENLRHLLEIDNYNTHARFLLAKAYIEKQEYEEALKHLEVVKLQISKTPELRFYFGKAYFGLKKYPEAINNLEEEMKLNRQSIETMILLGKAYSMNNDHQKAIEILNNAITLESGNAIAYFELGMAYLRKGDRSGAVEAFKQATNKAKDNLEFRFVFGKTMIENNMFNEGIEELKNVVKKAPDNTEYRFNLAMGYYLSKNYKAAITEFSKVVSQNPDNESAIFFIGKSYQAKREYDKALKAFNDCIKINKNNDKAFYEIARTYELMEKYDQSIEYYQKTIEKNPTLSMAYYRLGYIYKGKNNFKKAISFFEQFLKIAPEDDLAQEVKDEIFDLKEAIKDTEEEEKEKVEQKKKAQEEEE